MKEFWIKWIKEQRLLWAFFLIVELFIFLFQKLFALDNAVIGYLQLIITALFILYFIVVFSRDYRLYQSLKRELHDLSSPQYHTTIQLLIDEIKQLRNQMNQREEALQIFQKDQLDYYTMWAHQIKTPIAAMQLLLESEDVSVPLIRQELFKINQYVEFVLHYLRVESMHEDLLLRKVALDGVIRKSIKKYASFFIHDKIKLNYEGTQQSISTDEKWLGVIIEQLLSNAVKYAKNGEITIMVDENHLKISDNGIGIMPSDLERVFERGFTGYNGRLNEHASGLGLYLCRLIGDRLGLTLGIDSKVGEGTTVTISWQNRILAQD